MELNVAFQGDAEAVSRIKEFLEDMRLIVRHEYNYDIIGTDLLRSTYCYLLVMGKTPGISNHKLANILNRNIGLCKENIKSTFTGSINVWESLPYCGEVGIEFPRHGLPVRGFNELTDFAGTEGSILPLYVGEGLMGQSQVLDLGKMSHLFVIAQDYYALGQFICPLFVHLSKLQHVQTFQYALLDGVGSPWCGTSLPKNIEWGGMQLSECVVGAGDAQKSKWLEKATDMLEFAEHELNKRREILGELDFSQYNREHGNQAPHLVIFVVGAPTYSVGIAVAHRKFRDQIMRLLEANTERYGVHLVIADCEIDRDINEFVQECMLGQRGRDVRIGMFLQNTGDIMTSAEDVGLPEAGFVCRREMAIYRTPYNDIHRIRMAKECLEF